MANNVQVYETVKAVKDFNTTAINTSNGRMVDFTVYKDSTYDAVKRDDSYQLFQTPCNFTLLVAKSIT